MDLSSYKTFNIRGLKILVIPDLHILNNEKHDDLDRFYALAKMIADIQPDYVIILGDVGEFANVAPWIEKIDGQKALADAMAFKQALQILKSEVERINRRHIKNRRKDRCICVDTLWFVLEGNHEEWWRLRKETKMLGHDYLKAIAEDLGYIWKPFLEILWIKGIGFSHYKKTRKNKTAASITAMLAGHLSFFCGHEHTLEVRTDDRSDGSRITVGKLGHMMPPSRNDTEKGMWAGVTLLTEVTGNGACSVHTFSYDLVLEKYGSGGYAQKLRQQHQEDEIPEAF